MITKRDWKSIPPESAARKLAPVTVIFPLKCLYTIAPESGGADIQSLNVFSAFTLFVKQNFVHAHSKYDRNLFKKNMNMNLLCGYWLIFKKSSNHNSTAINSF